MRQNLVHDSTADGAVKYRDAPALGPQYLPYPRTEANLNRIANTSSVPTRSDPIWLRTLLLAGVRDVRPDAELLDRFARYGEQAAFEAILQRHGPLVWGVCRRTLRNAADADDAFQATFLVLVTKARGVKRGEQLGPWLYGVAYKVARRLRDKALRSPTCDPELAAMLPDRDRPADPDAEWLAHLDRELHALPAKFRDPMVLCELQGLSRTAAAERLRLCEGTLSSRLARGRILLRKRLLKHGTLLPAGGLATLLGTPNSAPARLLGRTAESVAQVTAASGLLAGVVPARVAKLALEMTGMGLFKLKIAAAMIAALAMLTLGLVAADGTKAKPDKPAAEVPKAVVGDGAKPVKVEDDLAALQGLWEVETVAVKVERHRQPQPQPQAGVWQVEADTGQPDPLEKPSPGPCFLVWGSNLWEFRMQGSYVMRYELRLTPGRNPKWIDFVSDGCSPYVSDQVPGVVVHGVYQVTADGWELGQPGSSTKLRPAEFIHDNNAQTTRFRRPKTPIAPDAKQADDRKKLLGRWSITRQAYPHDNRSAMVERPVGEVEITPEFLFIQRPTSDKKFIWEAAEYALDAAKDPKWIDLNFVGKPADANGYGVYESSGDTLRISYRVSVPRVFRTMEFKSGLEEPLKGSDGKPEAIKPACALLELKRIKTP